MGRYNPSKYLEVFYRWLPSQGSVFGAIMPFMVATLAVNVVLLVLKSEFKTKVGLPLSAHSIFGFLLSFLLVMRTTMAYQRYMEGYAAMSLMVRSARTATREILVAGSSGSDASVARCVRYIKAYLFVATKHLRSEALELEEVPDGLLTARETNYLAPRSRRSLLIIGWLAIEVEALHSMSAISDMHRLHLLNHLQALTDAFMGATRARAMFIPFPFAQVFIVSLTLYCFSLPIVLIPIFGRWSVALTAFACFVIFGTAEVARRLESAFEQYSGFEPIPLDLIITAAFDDIDAYVAQFSDFRRGLTFHRKALDDAEAVDDATRGTWIGLNSLAPEELGPPGEMTEAENVALGMAIETDTVPHEISVAVSELVELDEALERARSAAGSGMSSVNGSVAPDEHEQPMVPNESTMEP
ncbi:uncharacterized protein AMSG_01832 [Thecamonas trahens ATCC 50062]|uniref:Uncharacterized protein n=1 Tax=Thecamonas trahens ATCC 50062 TaxID=461836 RepID=A0A0L0DVN1_THETB|nr:hypothetical protein AMSG_01832 [Thecamonas trahens ATCC 50062]KNC55568.1 hypothetical protein AMSG_01832 [Thecamonas trahens ATCC 50062]|eukprot:XP_013761342.1 hypothetical protein AMSG_01832 [Thecamonas trahens ATCC 50062]